MKTTQLIPWMLAVAILLSWPRAGRGAPYGTEGIPTQFVQPDGMPLQLRVFGDEFYAVTETIDGYVVVYDAASKGYHYAALSADGSELLTSGIVVRAGDDPAALGFTRNLRISAESRRAKALKNVEAYDKVVNQTGVWDAKKAEARAWRNAIAEGPDSVTALAAPSPTTGDIVGIVILVDFSDREAQIPTAQIDDFFNKPNYTGYSNRGSVFDYFYRQSARKLRFNNVVTHYVRLPEPRSYYNNTSVSAASIGRYMLEQALDILTAQGFDFSGCTASGETILSCTLLFAGNDSGVWNAGLWPHTTTLQPTYSVSANRRIYRYQMTDISSSLSIGTTCHESGHMVCGYPDLYDYDDDSEGCGKYSLMGHGNIYYARSPVGVGAYLRYSSGWVDAVELTSNMNERCSVRIDDGRIYRYSNPVPLQLDEYFLIENRSKMGWEMDSGLPDEGLTIMHCDESGSRDRQNMTEALHYECSIEQADNAFDLEYNSDRGDAYDLFHSGGTGANTAFSDVTSPNAHWWRNATTDTTSGDPSGLDIHSISAAGETMTFVVGAGTPSGTPEIGIDQSVVHAETDYGTDAAQLEFAVWNKQGGTLTYSISSDSGWLSVTPSTGSATTESDVIDLVFDSDGLAAGTYSATITVSDGGAANSPQTMDVQLVVFDPPLIGVNTNLFGVDGNSGDAAGQQLLVLSNAGGSALDYMLSTNGSSWLSLSSTNGTVTYEQDVIVLDFDATALPPGIYQDTITISSSAANSPVYVAVEFNVSTGPVAWVGPTNLAFSASVGGADGAGIVISNSGGRALTFTVSDSLPPNDYSWKSTDDVGGPVFSWVDISTAGTAYPLGDEGESGLLPIGFDFPFYETDYNQFMIGANGCVSFIEEPLGYNNDSLPAGGAPSQCLFPFWDDMNPGASGEIRYHSTPERLVVSWIGVPRYGTSDDETFQVIIHPDGRIVYQYNTLNGTLTSCTVGLQADSSVGPALQIAHNETLLKNGMAIEISPPETPWLTYATDSGIVSTGAAESVWFTASAAGLGTGVHTALVTVACNDLVNPEYLIPVSFTVTSDEDDADGDGLPDWWEALYFGGTTSADPNAFCSNGINTVRDAYIAGFNPTNSAAGFSLTGISNNVIGWSAATGRFYTIYWSTNLTHGFSILQSNYVGGVYTDLLHSAESEAFYQIKAEIAP